MSTKMRTFAAGKAATATGKATTHGHKAKGTDGTAHSPRGKAYGTQRCSDGTRPVPRQPQRRQGQRRQQNSKSGSNDKARQNKHIFPTAFTIYSVNPET